MTIKIKTFLKNTAKDHHSRSLNPPIVRASTTLFKSHQEIRKIQNLALKNPSSNFIDYGRQGTNTTVKLQNILLRKETPSIYHYKDMVDFFLRKELPDFQDYPCIIPNWDNSPRFGKNALVIHGSTPELFRIHLKKALQLIEPIKPERKIIFLKAWNEWAEGNYVEPDLKFGHGYLDVIKEEIT